MTPPVDTALTATVPTAAPPEMVTAHYYCCDRARAMCGENLDDAPELPGPAGQVCVVCADLTTSPCQVCGITYR